MLYMPKVADYLKILTDEEMKDFVVITFGECFKSMRELLYSKLGEKKSLRKVDETFYTFSITSDEVEKYVELNEKTPVAKIMIQPSIDGCIHHYNIEILNLFDSELQLINTKLIIKTC